MLKRQLTDIGLNPFVGFMIAAIGFSAFSVFLFSKSINAPYYYVLIALSPVFKFAEINRNDFLKFTFSKAIYLKIRLIENLILVLPFMLFLSIKKEIFLILLLTVLSQSLVFLQPKKSFTWTMPTPFYKKPFEFIIGFRSWAPAIVLAYFLLTMAFLFQNFSLGAFSLLFIFLICLSFYNEPENVFYVWVHNLRVNEFLFDKIKTAVIFSSMLTLPAMTGLLLFFKEHSFVILGFQLLGYCYLITMLLAKYAAFPEKINLPQGILLGFSLTMPPLLLALFTYFYFQAKKQLKEILE